MRYNTIYLDMDGVLADFDSAVKKLLGKSLHDFPTSQAGWDAMEPYKETFFRTLDPMPDAYELVTGVINYAFIRGMNTAVLTAIPKLNRFPGVHIDKREWVREHFPKLYNDFNIGPYAIHKQLHCYPGDVLIDDNPMNIEQWNACGGIGIFHTSAEDSLAKLKKHLEI